MKTVMKKIFSLMLVAVLLVSAVPFAASAAEETKSWDLTLAPGSYNVDAIVAQHYTGSSTNYWVHRTAPSAVDYIKGASFEAVEGGTYTLYVVETVADPEPADPCANGHNYTETVTTQPTCTAAGEKTLTCSRCSDTSTAPVAALGHNYTETVTTQPTCTNAGEKTFTCGRCNDTGTASVAALGHSYANGFCSRCSIHESCGEKPCTCSVTVTLVDRKHSNSTVAYKPGQTVTLSEPAFVQGYKFLGWKLNGTGDYIASFTVPGTAINGANYTIEAMWEQTYTTPTYTLKVVAELYTGDVRVGQVAIHEKSGFYENDAILDYLFNANTKAIIENKIASSYSNYEWNNKYYNGFDYIVDGTTNITTVNGYKQVYIKLTASEDKVQVYVHTKADTKDYDRIFDLHGYKIGDLISNAEVKSVLKKHYGSGFTMIMFNKEGFANYLNGKPNTDSAYVEVQDEYTEIHVRLYNTSSSSSSSNKAQADNSNPKTGDEIFAPVAVLGASVSALAVLFYLNKKRAY